MDDFRSKLIRISHRLSIEITKQLLAEVGLRPIIGIGPLSDDEVDARLAKLELAKQNLKEALEAIDGLQELATRNKSEIAELNRNLEKARFDKVAVSNQIETLKSLASLDSDAVKKALGLPSRTGVIAGWAFSFVLGIATSFSASYLYDLWKP